MIIDKKLIAYLEDLSYLSLTDAEKTQLGKDLQNILGNMERLGGLDTENVPERSHPFDNNNAFRDDIVQPSYHRERILNNAPESDGETFIAPRTVE